MNSNLKENVNWREEQIWTYKEMAQYLRKSVATIKSERSRNHDAFPPTLSISKAPRWDKDVVINWYKEQSWENRKRRRPRKY